MSTPHPCAADAPRADPDVLAVDPFAAEKLELDARLAHITDAMRRPKTLEGVDEQTVKSMREVLAAGGESLTTTQAIRFIDRLTLRAADRDHINLGRPWRVPKQAKGPWSRDTRYDVAHERTKGHLHRLVRLPGLRVGQGKIDIYLMAKLAAKLVADGEGGRDLIGLIFDRSHEVLKPTSSGEQIDRRELRKARALLVSMGRWPELLR